MIDKRDRSLSISIARAVRAQRGDDVRVVRCLWVGYDQAALGSVVGFHIADIPLFLPDRETSRKRLETQLWF